MSKDVIYIDVEDDITAIISKVKATEERIIALVPPKRVGVLQSAVNLRLLARAAEQSKKRIVLITSNGALSALAAAAAIPVAKNLQSKPELAEIPLLEIDEGDDIIDGAQLPVGEHAKTVATPSDAKEEDLIQGVDVEEEATSTAPMTTPSAPKKKPGKVPNFTTFRKRLVIGISAGVVLIAVVVWALVFAPRATVVVKAKTTPVQVTGVVVLGGETNATNGTLKAEVQTIEKETSIEFAATGEENKGEKATGTVRFTTSSPTAQTIAAGTVLTTNGGLTFALSAAVSLPGATLSFSCGGICPGTATGTAAASEPGEKYNAASGSLSGAPSGVSAAFTGATSGGTTKIVPIVSAADVQAAREKLVEQSSDAEKKELEAKFGKDIQVITDSFFVERADAVSVPAIGQEAADKKAKLTSNTTYRMNGVSEASLRTYIEQALKAQMEDQTAQKIYGTGAKSATLTDFRRDSTTLRVRLNATGQIGPVINEDEIKQEVAGKRYGEIRSELTRIDGVNDVEVKFPYFWVRTVPNNLERITIEFAIEGKSE